MNITAHDLPKKINIIRRVIITQVLYLYKHFDLPAKTGSLLISRVKTLKK